MAMISQKHKCIFIHIPKNAGGSVRQMLTLEAEGTKPGGIHQHVPAITLRKLNPQQYDNFFTFAFVRNPWARMWSIYKFALERKGQGHVDVGNSFDDFLMNKKKVHNWATTFTHPAVPVQRRPQVDWLFDQEGNNIVDFVGRFENLQQDMKFICSRINLPVPVLRVAHKTSNQISYTEAYSPQGIDFIAEHFMKDIELFNYEFGK